MELLGASLTPMASPRATEWVAGTLEQGGHTEAMVEARVEDTIKSAIGENKATSIVTYHSARGCRFFHSIVDRTIG